MTAHPYDAALAQLTDAFTDAPDSFAHTTMIGLRKKDGAYAVDEPDCLIVQTPTPKGEHVAYRDKEIPPDIMWGGERIHVDVQASVERHAPKLLHLNSGPYETFGYQTQAGEQHRACMNRVLGGAQCQPPPGQWVGTAGMMMGFKQPDGSIIWGMITNAHVTGFDAAPGTIMGQPLMNKGYARVIKVHDISRANNAQNKVDLAQLDCRGSDGKLTCFPDFVTFGRQGIKWKDAELRMLTGKDGRTTGGTGGDRKVICVGIHAVSAIGYGPGDNRRFTDLDVHAKENGGDMSAPGDSGSAIIELESKNFVSHLFAGGGGQTLGCAARHVMAACNGVLPQITG